jgi:protein-tyrosine phosphatase
LIDLHCHILPEIDDGPSTLEESLRMAKIAVEDGIHSIVASPHTLNGLYENPARKILSHMEKFKKSTLKNNIDLELFGGADVHLCPDILDRIENGHALTINNTGKYILLEFPSQMIPQGIKDFIFKLKLNGITPVITHPERNPFIQRDPHILYEFITMGALSQVTAMSLTGDFGKYVMYSAQILLKHRLIHIIASDAHTPFDRPPILSHAVERAAEILENYNDAERMVTSIPSSILSGKPPDIPEPVQPK